MMRLIRLLIVPLAFALTASAPAGAQDYPAPSDPYINDLAAVIGTQDAAALRADLDRLRTETGIEATVLTLPQRPADGRTLEAYATGLFNAWGIGDAARNDGILVLVVLSGREMRVELGSGYDQDDDLLAQDIVSRVFLPRFREAAYSAGIAQGTREVIDRIARRHAQGLEPLPLAGGDRGWLGLILPAAAAGLAVLVLLRRRIGGWAFGFRRCPQCGARGLHQHEEGPATQDVVSPDSGTTATRRIVTSCPRCGWQERHEAPDGRAAGARSSGSSFGGGKSSGGGASGRW